MNMLQLLTPKCDVKVLYSHYSVRRALEVLGRCGYSAIPVISRYGDYVGCVCEGDFLWQIVREGDIHMRDEEEHSIISIMRKNYYKYVKVSASLDELMECMVNQNFAPIVDDRNKFIGIITRRDIIKYLLSKEENGDYKVLQNAGGLH